MTEFNCLKIASLFLKHNSSHEANKHGLIFCKNGGSSTYDVIARPQYATDSRAHCGHPTAEGHATCASLQSLDDALHLLTGRVPEARVNVATLCR